MARNCRAFVDENEIQSVSSVRIRIVLISFTLFTGERTCVDVKMLLYMSVAERHYSGRKTKGKKFITISHDL